MAKMIKIFKTNKAPVELEKEVNQWLRENPNVINLFPSGVQGANEAAPVLIVLYESQTGGMGQSPDNLQRQHDRLEVFEIVDYSVDGRYYRDFMEDLSESGVFIRTHRTFPPGKELTITLMPPEQERSIRIKGEVVRSLAEGIGVRFVKESEVQADVIRSVMASLQKRPRSIPESR